MSNIIKKSVRHFVIRNCAERALDRLLTIEWPPLQRRLEEAIKKASPIPQEIHGILTEMEPINRWYYQRSVAQLSGIAGASDRPVLKRTARNGVTGRSRIQRSRV